MTKGVCIIALGYQLYGESAYNLALSLKAFDPDCKIALLTDDKATESLHASCMEFFDTIIQVPDEYVKVGAGKQYQRAKLCVDLLSPFDETMLIDADTIWFDRPISWLMGEVSAASGDIQVPCNSWFNYSKRRVTRASYTFWGEPVIICERYKVRNLPQTLTGIFFFRKGEFSSQVFKRAREVYDEKGSPCIVWANGKPDEFCLNVALAEKGVMPPEKQWVYFKQTCGSMLPEAVLTNYWGLAMGGSIIGRNLAEIFNRLVNKYSIKMKRPENLRYYHKDKKDHVKERAKY